MDIVKDTEELQKEFSRKLRKRNIIVNLFVLACFCIPLSMIALINYGMPELYKKRIIAIQVEGTPTAKNVQYVDAPIINSTNIKTWLKEALNKSFSYNSVDYKDHSEKIAPYYTQRGFDRFMVDFKEKSSKNFNSGIAIVNSLMLQEPVIIKSKKFDVDKRAWQYYVKIEIFYKGQFGNGYYSYDTIVDVIETDPKDYKQGIAIDDIKIK